VVEAVDARSRPCLAHDGHKQWAGGTGEVDDGGGRKKDVTWLTWQITVARNGQSRDDSPAKYIY